MNDRAWIYALLRETLKSNTEVYHDILMFLSLSPALSPSCNK